MSFMDGHLQILLDNIMSVLILTHRLTLRQWSINIVNWRLATLSFQKWIKYWDGKGLLGAKV